MVTTTVVRLDILPIMFLSMQGGADTVGLCYPWGQHGCFGSYDSCDSYTGYRGYQVESV